MFNFLDGSSAGIRGLTPAPPALVAALQDYTSWAKGPVHVEVRAADAASTAAVVDDDNNDDSDGDVGVDAAVATGVTIDDAEAEYQAVLRLSNFTVCPFDEGGDGHRFWEAVEAGSIPVVVRADTDRGSRSGQVSVSKQNASKQRPTCVSLYAQPPSNNSLNNTAL